MITYDIEWKQGDVDEAGAVVSDANGLVDLTDKTVVLSMKDVETGLIPYKINCLLSGSYNGMYYSAARGGVTIPFSKIETLVSGLFKGEFIVTGPNKTVHVPSGNNYLSIMIWEEV